MKLILILFLIISIVYSNAGDVDTSTLYKDIKSDMLRGLIIAQLNKNIESFKLDVYYQVTNETKAAEGKRLAIIGEKELFLNKTLLQECIDKKVVLILMNISMDDKAQALCKLVSVCNPNSDDYYIIFIPAHESYSEYAFSLYKNKKTEAPSKLVSSSEAEPSNPPQNKISNEGTNLNSNTHFNDLAQIIEKEGLFQKYNFEKNVQKKNEKGEKVIEKRIIENDRTGTVFGGKTLAADEKYLEKLIEKRVPIAIIGVSQQEKEIFCKMVEGCSEGDSNFVLYVPYFNEKDNLEKVTIYDYLKDGSKNSFTFYND